MRKLPVTGALGHAIKSTTDNIGFAFHISWPWMLLLLPLIVAVTCISSSKAYKMPNT